MTKIKDELLDRQMTQIKMGKKTLVFFTDVVECEPAPGKEKSKGKKTEYPVKSEHLPHKDFTAAMRKLLPYAFDAIGMKIDGGDGDYSVCAVKIKGDISMNKARIVLTIIKQFLDGDKAGFTKFATGEIMLNEASHLDDWKDLKKAVEKCVTEAYEYIGGKHEDDNTPLAIQLQLSLESDDKGPRKKRQQKADIPGIMKKDTVIPDTTADLPTPRMGLA